MLSYLFSRLASRTAMKSSRSSRVTQLLEKSDPGDRSAAEQLFADVYAELHELAARYFAGNEGPTLQPTALVHEAYLKLVGQRAWIGRAGPISWRLPRKPCEKSSWIMRDGTRRPSGAAIGIASCWTTTWPPSRSRDVDLLALEDALTKLTKLDPRQAQMIELRFFGGMDVAEVAKEMGMSKRSAEREWTMVRAWLRRELSGSGVP